MTDTATASAAGCVTCDEQGGYSRRSFLRGLSAAVAATAATSMAVSTRVAYAADPTYSGPVLVMISLRGGFDGMSAVAPIGDPNYALLRPTIAVPTSTALDIGDRTFGLHPSLAPLKPLWDAGKMAAVHAVENGDRTRSHFSAMSSVEAAAPGTSLRTGWLDRVMSAVGGGTAFEAVQLGGGTTPGLLAGPAPLLSSNNLKSFNLQWGTSAPAGVMLAALRNLHTDPTFPATAPANLTLDAITGVQTMITADPGVQNGATYPANSHLGAALADAAILLRSSVGVQAITIDVGDWDMHSGLGAAGTGWMARNLTDLASSLAAFAADLGPTTLNRVTIMTMSEFGRRAAENASNGLDHGHGNVMFVLGGGLSASKVFGTWPTLASNKLDSGDLAGTTDYRAVLADFLSKRAGMSADGLNSVFPGFKPVSPGVFA